MLAQMLELVTLQTMNAILFQPATRLLVIGDALILTDAITHAIQKLAAILQAPAEVKVLVIIIPIVGRHIYI